MDNNIRIIQYLGSKIKIIDDIVEEIKKITEPGDVVVDLFAGSGVVAQALANEYTVIANDVQEYSYVITSSLIKDILIDKEFPSYDSLIMTSAYQENKKYLEEKFARALQHEKEVLNNCRYDELAELCECNVFYNNQNVAESEQESIRKIFGEAYELFCDEKIEQLRLNPKKNPYMLFTLYYSNSYFSLEQCLEIDSLKCAIDMVSEGLRNGEEIRTILLSCLLHAVSEVVSSVGKNFAQPIKVMNSKGEIKDFAIRRCMKDRKLCVKDFFTRMYDILSSKKIKLSEENTVKCGDYSRALCDEGMQKVKTFYLDPPYTIDHYSRFYHVLETLIKYDYPVLEERKVNGKIMLMNGRYRNDRFQSNFCISSKGCEEFENMICTISNFNSNIVMSYSDANKENDTRQRVVSKEKLLEIVNRYYNNVEVRHINHRYRKLSVKESNRKEIDNGELLIICRV